jgi:hypothetical protein
MALHTRRGVLLGAAGLLAGLAGCNEDTGDDGTPAERTPTDPGEPRDVGEDGTRDPEQYALRGDDDGVIAWFAEGPGAAGADTSDSDGTTDAGTIPPDERRDEGVIADEATAATLSFGDVDGAEEAREFVEATDFDSESIYLDQTPLGDCYRLELCSADWGGEELSLRYVSVLQDYDVACSGRDRDTLAMFVRVPVALDPDRRANVERSNRGVQCGQGRIGPTPSDRNPGEMTATAASGGDDR